MGLSRLDQFLKSTRGTTLHVNPDSLDATDSIENTGSSPVRPFKTIQRAIAEAVRYSYQAGKGNDRFNRTTILLYPGEHVVDNRPGYILTDAGAFRSRSGETPTDFAEWDNTTNYDLTVSDNALYKLNSVHGGIILPRGVSLVGQDLRKTTIRPLYVPNPVNDNIETSAIFRVTGASFIYGFTIFDADPNGICYKDYTKNTFVPNFSHHKLNGFEYADGVNPISIADDFLTFSTTRTDLDNFYQKVGLVYGQSSGRAINNDFPSTNVDIEPVVDEYRIVGSRGREVGITSAYAGNSATSSTTITVTLAEPVTDINVDTPIQIQGITAPGYEGQYVVSAVPNSTTIQYKVQNAPENPNPSTAGATLNIVVDTVTSASPYIFNISLRSVYGMCGLLADGSKADGFKSMVIAQYTGIGLQKDDNAFVKYDSNAGVYQDSTEVANLSNDSRALYKPVYENYHIKATNNAFLQLVSIFSIGFSQHFVAENGGDFSITNSNSNFGAKSLVSKGYRSEAFLRDNFGYITHLINPRELDTEETTIEFLPIDINQTISVGQTNRLYLYGYQNTGEAPDYSIDGYKIGAKENDELYVQVSQGGVTNTYSAKIVMPNTGYTTRNVASKSFDVATNVSGISSIGVSGNNIIDLSTPHTFISGEGVKVFSENGDLPDGIISGQTYYVIASDINIGLSTSQIKLAQSETNAINDQAIDINSNGGKLRVVSRVIDKASGDYGHPIQNDSAAGGWYINVSGISTENNIYSTIVGLGTTGLGEATSRTFIRRRQDDRKLGDKIYKVRYVIPKESTITARPPLEGYILQDASSGIGTGTSEIQKYFATSATLLNPTELRSFNFIAGATWSSNTVTITTELPHNLSVGSEVLIENIIPTGYNGTYTITGTPTSRQFTYTKTSNPGAFASDTTARNANLPRFTRKKYNDAYYVYKVDEVQEYLPNEQDGVYHLILLNASNSPSVAPFNNLKFSQPIQYLYPQLNRDNPNTNPRPARSLAVRYPIGQVISNDPERSVTRETIEKQLFDGHVGSGITNIVSSASTSHIIYTSQDHQFSGITSVSITSAGSNYLEGTYYGVNLIGGSGSSASAKVTVNATGNVSNVTIMHPGGGYVYGNTLTVVPPVGVGTTTGFSAATVFVDSINDGSGDIISVYGVTGNQYENYNGHYTISSVSGPKQLNVVSSAPISGFTTTGIGVTASTKASYIQVGKIVPISTITYNASEGTASVGFTTSHGFRVNNKIILSGADDDFFNGEFIVSNVTDVKTAIINTGIATVTPSTGGTVVAYRTVLSSSFGDDRINESRSGRLSYEYAGITTITGSILNFNDPDNTTITIPNAVILGLKLGDYILIDDEILRIRATVSGNNVSVFRSLFGTPRQTHPVGSVVRRINVYPVELRRHSIVRASGHTFEYLGFGPGNYSTSLPEKQDRILSQSEEIISLATKTEGGAIVFSGMNSDGDFYTGNKIIKSSTGQEEVYDAPIPSVTGETDTSKNVTSELISSSDVIISRSLKVEGGSNKDLVSEFSGPVLFNNKVSSSDGIEAKDFYIQGEGEVSRKITVSDEKPVIAGNYGDINFNSEPSKNEFIGWTYVTENKWEPFGFVGSPGVGIASAGTYVGFSTLINLVATGFTFNVTYDAVSGVSTLTWDADPRIAISTGGANNFLGRVKQLNFVGAGVTVTGSTDVGIATIQISAGPSIAGTTPGEPYNSLQWNNNDGFAGVPVAFYDDNINQVRFGSLFNDKFSVFFDETGSIGIGTNSTQAKVDIVTDNEKSVYIRTTSGLEVLRIDNTANDTTPLIIDGSGSIGINTDSTVASLDVVGDTAVTGDLRIYELDRSNYVGLRARSLSSNYIYTLPNSYGTSGNVLTSDGEGALYWSNGGGVRRIIPGSNISISPSSGTGDVVINATGGTISTTTVITSGILRVAAGTGIQVTGGDGPTALITNIGVTKINAGPNVSITPVSGTGEVTISASGGGGTSGITNISAGPGIQVLNGSGPNATIINTGITNLTAGTAISIGANNTINNIGVTKIISGVGVSISPGSGVGEVIINAVGTGGLGTTGIFNIVAGNGIQVIGGNGPTAQIINTGITTINAGTGIAIGANNTITNTGVTRIYAGSNISIVPTGGTGEVTINANSVAGITTINSGIGITIGSNNTIINTGITTINAGVGITIGVNNTINNAGVTKIVPGTNVSITPGTGVGEVIINTDVGVKKIIAGSNITITPVEGTGEVTITAAGGGGGGGGGGIYPFTTRGFSLPI